ncbi:MAG: phospholipid carrier-dependent glycosyltransferase [Candidatus Roizmanbacteria bacterium]|nr:phospholipid carrier-dependent glycosyltransferase [Candidatus Roizmanbacteria bacterium]
MIQSRLLIKSIIFLQILLIAYYSRSVFIGSYDAVYWKDRYEHSQWVLPLSRRSIGDDALFSHVGREIAYGADPTFSISHVPPVGKYLLGWSIRYFQNYVWYTFLIGIASTVLYYYIARLLLRNTVLSLFAVMLLIFDPLFFSQFTVSLLDLTQLFFLLVTLLFILLTVKVNSKTAYSTAIIAGISLGLTAQVKLPITIPVVFVLCCYYLFRRKNAHITFLFVISSVLGFVIPYFGFFLKGHSLMEFINITRYMIGFYRESELTTHWGALLSVLFIGKFPHIASGESTNVIEWSIMWPISSILFFAFLVSQRKLLTTEFKGVAWYIIISLLIYLSIPAFPRYLLMVTPFLYLFLAHYLGGLNKNYLLILVVLISFYGIFNTYRFNYLKSIQVTDNYLYSYSHQFYQDIYQQYIAHPEHLNLTREEFHQLLRTSLNDAQIRNITVHKTKQSIPFLGSRGYVEAEITYQTQHLGSFTEKKIIPLVKTHGEWKIEWNWDLLVQGYRPDYKMVSTIVRGKRGSIVDRTGTILAEDREGYLISVNPYLLNYSYEQEMLELLGNLASTKPVHLQNAYLEDPVPDSAVPVISTFRILPDDELKTLKSYPGVELLPYQSRIYSGIPSTSIQNVNYEECCTRLYSATNYTGMESLELQYNDTLLGADGGTLLLTDKNGAAIRVILDKEPIVGKNVQL